MRKILRDKSFFFLILVNLVPLIGVAFWSWSVFSVIYFYWLETVVVAFWLIVKILKTDLKNFGKMPNSSASVERVALALFFGLIFGASLLFYRVFLLAIFGPSDIEPMITWFSLMALFVAHGFQYFEHFVVSGEYVEPTKKSNLLYPLRRLFILHIVILLGGMISALFGLPVLIVVLLVIVKILTEVISVLKPHTGEGKQ